MRVASIIIPLSQINASGRIYIYCWEAAEKYVVVYQYLLARLADKDDGCCIRNRKLCWQHTWNWNLNWIVICKIFKCLNVWSKCLLFAVMLNFGTYYSQQMYASCFQCFSFMEFVVVNRSFFVINDADLL